MSLPAQQPQNSPHFPEGAAVVLGGSGGIGGAICEAFGRNGVDVALSYRSNAAAAEALCARLAAMGRKASAVRVDASDPASIERGLKAVAQQFGRIHSLVYATGADISMAYVADVDPEEWRRTIEGDLNGFFHVVKAALPLLRAGGGGSVIAVTTAGMDRHPPMDILSVAPKAGIEALIRGIAREEGRYNIRANSVAPGVIDAGLFHRLTPQVTPQFVEAMKRNTALKRFGTAEEVAALVVFLASTPAGYITGQRIAVDGGYSV
ncbi:MAG: SDR family oxidoreductase [Candidatus Parcubacteria bacterium]|nr:SDR family oxidoreductase [Burkholderiales bacterium]